MSITETATIDGMGIDKNTGEVVLTISDHLDWKDERGHLSAIEEKVNAYLGYLESGQLVEDMPEAAGRPPKIWLINKFHPSDDAEQVLENLKRVLAGNEIAFQFGELPAGY